MKKIVTKFAAYVILAVMMVMLIPGITNRISHENKNNNITISVLYNQFISAVSANKVNAVLDEFKAIGVNKVSLLEDDLNAMVNRGDVTSIKYNVLRHKYDDESMEIAELIAEKCPEVSYDSHIIIASREEAKERLAYVLPRKYTRNEYCDVGVFDDLHIYVMYDGRKELYKYTLGYNESVIKELKNRDFDIVLTYTVRNYSSCDYIEDIDRLVKEYDVEYLNLKMDANEYSEVPVKDKNYKRLTEIINENDMTLVVTENWDQLSNQKFLGYEVVFNGVMKEGGSQKVARSYETQDDSQQDESKYKYRTEQFFNSTIDRNIRFITVLPQVLQKTSAEDSADYTVKAVKEYKEKVEKLGYTVNQENVALDYQAEHRPIGAICAVIMVMCLLLMFRMVTGTQDFRLTLGAIILAALGAAGTLFVIPESLLSLYPTIFCVVQSCMAMTAVLYFIKTQKDRLSYWIMAPASVCILLGVLLLGAVCMGSMLSGIEYYINNVIFRGIKISLIIPIIYTTVVYYFMFMRNEKSTVFGDIKKVLNAEVKVYWLAIAVVVAAVGAYYLIRSGNVNSISGFEKAMRSAATELFPARPRTKEFLIGYPALILFVYYMKKYDIQLIRWLLAIAASILAASITNSFCHIFTNFTTIVSRTLNGLLVGIVVSVAVFVANLILVKVCKLVKDRMEKSTEMR